MHVTRSGDTFKIQYGRHMALISQLRHTVRFPFLVKLAFGGLNFVPYNEMMTSYMYLTPL